MAEKALDIMRDLRNHSLRAGHPQAETRRQAHRHHHVHRLQGL